MDSISGIYIILNTANGKIYIGKAKNLKRRWKEHRSKLNCGHHCNRHLQAAWNKYGENRFEFKVLEHCVESQLDEREKHHISIYKGRKLAYNLTDGGDGAIGVKRSLETRQRMSEANKRRPPKSAEHRRKLSEALKGKSLSNEIRNKMSESSKGKLHTEETKRKISESHKAENLSDETRRKLSDGAKRREARKRAERDNSE